MSALYHHYSEFTGAWPWKNFTPREVSCSHCGELFLDEAALTALQYLRDDWGRAIIVTSGHRCSLHNNAVGGTENSRHLQLAFDCAVLAKDQPAFLALAREAGFTGIGKYPGRNFVHLDLGPRREWCGPLPWRA